MSSSTNQKQLETMVNLLDANRDIANGFTTNRSKEDVKKFWNLLEKELNSAGPPMKSIFEWKKVWVDKKKYIKKKLSENKKNQNATGGGPCKEYRFTSLEEAIIKICSMSESVEGLSNASRFGLPSCEKKRKLIADEDDTENENTVVFENNKTNDSLKPSEIEESPLLEMLFDDADNCSPSNGQELFANNSYVKALPKPHMPTKGKSSQQLLEEEIKIQREMCDKVGQALSDMKSYHENTQANVKKIYRSIDRLYDQQKLALQETKRHNMEMERLRKREIEAKLQYKERLIEIEEEKLQIMK